MGTNNLTIKRFASIEEAPTYRLPEFKAATLEEAGIVKRGTVGGNSTVDLIFKDESGQKYIAMITMSLLKGVTVGE